MRPARGPPTHLPVGPPTYLCALPAGPRLTCFVGEKGDIGGIKFKGFVIVCMSCFKVTLLVGCVP